MNNRSRLGKIRSASNKSIALKQLRAHLPLFVGDYGAVGDGVTDDTAAIQNAINAAISQKKALQFEGKIYLVNREIEVSGDVEIVGSHFAQTSIRAVAQMRSILHVNSVSLFHHLTLDCQRLASYGALLSNSSGSVFEYCTFYLAKIDGCHLDDSAGNDGVKFLNCSFELCGAIYHSAGMPASSSGALKTLVAGTVSIAANPAKPALAVNSAKVIGNGTSFLSMGIREGDFIAFGATNTEWLQIYSVDSDTQITCTLHPPCLNPRMDQEFQIGVGDGCREQTHNENNLCIHERNLYRNNAGSGARFAGLYGPRVSNCQNDFNGAFGFSVGQATNSNVIGSSFQGVYFEDLGTTPFFLGYAAGISIDTVNCAGPACTLSNPSFNWGTISNVQNASDPGRIDPIGADPLNYIPIMVLASGAYAKGILQGQNYAQNGPGLSSLTMRDALVTSVALISGSADATNGIGFSFDTAYLLAAAGAKLISLRNRGTEKFSISKDGILAVDSSDTSNSPGDATINKPAGRVALAAGTNTLTITNSLVTVASRVLMTKQQLDKTATDFMLVPRLGSFVITSNTIATANITFDFLVIN